MLGRPQEADGEERDGKGGEGLEVCDQKKICPLPSLSAMSRAGSSLVAGRALRCGTLTKKDSARMHSGALCCCCAGKSESEADRAKERGEIDKMYMICAR